MGKKIIIYIIIIVVILITVYLSQQAYLRGIGKTLISAAKNRIPASLTEGSNSAISDIYSKINDQIKSGGETIQNGANQVNQNISAAYWNKNLQNYFSGIANSIAGKNNSCTTVKHPTN